MRNRNHYTTAHSHNASATTDNSNKQTNTKSISETAPATHTRFTKYGPPPTTPPSSQHTNSYKVPLTPAPSTLAGHISHYVRTKIYLYELTTGIYMLEPWEKSIFNAVVVVFLCLVLYACVSFVPLYASYVVTQSQYYLGI